jgi:sulfatase modifying factor 1
MTTTTASRPSCILQSAFVATAAVGCLITAALPACGDKFSSCEAHRNCPPTGGNGGASGESGTAGDENGAEPGTSGQFGTMSGGNGGGGGSGTAGSGVSETGGTGGGAPDSGGRGGAHGEDPGTLLAGSGGEGGDAGAKGEPICTPNEPACDDNRATTCDSTGFGYLPGGTPCGESATCKAGVCEEHTCKPNADFCAEQAVRRCSSDGLSSSPKATCDGATPFCESGACTATPPSCHGLAVNCGPSGNESCCTSPLISGGTFKRSDGYLATVSNFRLDKFEVTVGRFRRFVDAVLAGWRPAMGSGKHGHVNGGKGLSRLGAPGHELGWDDAWSQATIDFRLYTTKVDWDTSLVCTPKLSSWTFNKEGNEHRPINCVNWYQAYAFCIWDGGFLPSESEWNYAAVGGNQQLEYPWGNYAPSADLAVYGCNRGTPAGTCNDVTSIWPVGSLASGNGRFGQSDLAGNIAEWTLDVSHDLDPAACADCAFLEYEPPDGRVRRGGWFSGAAFQITTRGVVDPRTVNEADGIRCARSP